MRMWLQVLWEILWTIAITWCLSAILAFPVWGLIAIFLWTNVSYLGAWYVTASIMTGLCIWVWVLDLARGVRM